MDQYGKKCLGFGQSDFPCCVLLCILFLDRQIPDIIIRVTRPKTSCALCRCVLLLLTLFASDRAHRKHHVKKIATTRRWTVNSEQKTPSPSLLFFCQEKSKSFFFSLLFLFCAKNQSIIKRSISYISVPCILNIQAKRYTDTHTQSLVCTFWSGTMNIGQSTTCSGNWIQTRANMLLWTIDESEIDNTKHF